MKPRDDYGYSQLPAYAQAVRTGSVWPAPDSGVKRAPGSVRPGPPLPDAAPGTLRAALVAHIPSVLDKLGCDSAQALRRAGIEPERIQNGECTIRYDAVGRLLDEGVRATGFAHFGLIVGEHFSPAVALGEVMELMRNAPSIRVALRSLVLHHRFNDTGAVPMLLPVAGRRVALAHVILGRNVPAIDAFYDAAISYGMQIMRLLCGRVWSPLQVRLAHVAPRDDTSYRRMFGPNLRFNATLSAIEFDAELLHRPVADADPARFAELRELIRAKLLAERSSFADQVERALRPMIVAGTATASNSAKLFAISDRVLRDRLALEGTGFRRLLLHARLDLATQLLRSTRLSVAEIGAAVGYADPPSFVRAFRSRFNSATPGDWRTSVAQGAV